MKFRNIVPVLIVFTLLASTWPVSVHAQFRTSDFSFDHYHDYDEISAELETLASEKPEICNLIILGQTWEGRDIMALRLTDNPDIEEFAEPDILIMGAHHARELPSAEVPMYILEFLAGNYSTNSTVRQLVDSRDIWFVPLVNPDGREYAMNVDVNWRKNRRPIDLDGDGIPEGTGVDPNRNYGHLWGQQGTSADPTSSLYCGPSAFSENETRAIRTLAENQNFSISLSYHTYGEVIYYPWNNGIDTVSPRGDVLTAIADDLGGLTGYKPMEGIDAYPTTGDSDDWLYADTDCLPFTIEIGTQFAAPPNGILPLCEKNLDAAIYALQIADDPEKAVLPDWTFMVYMAADADQALANEAIVDLNEMEVTGSSSELNIIVLYDGPNSGDSKIYRIEKDPDGYNTAIISSTVDDLDQVVPATGEVDMSQYHVMGDFARWAAANYPARNYFLDIWGHGNGILNGFAYDRGSLMQVDDISQALDGLELDIVGFDACSMGHFEVAAELAGISDILIGSEAEEPISGWDYMATLQKLAANTNMNPRELARNIVLDYFDSVTASYSTLAAIDLHVFQEDFLPLLNEFARVSLDFAYHDYRNIWMARNYTDTFVTAADAVDIFEFLKNLDNVTMSESVTTRIHRFMELKNELVIESGSGTGHPDSDSMAVYFPVMGAAVPAKYLSMDFAVNLWDEYLEGINSPVPKPNITVSGPSGEINNTGPQSITASVSPAGFNNLELLFRVDSGIWNGVSMNASDGQFSGTIPGQANGSVVEYYIMEPDANITEPYEVKWGSEAYLNYTILASCDPAIVGFSINPASNPEEGNVTSFVINYTNFGPGYALFNLSLEASSAAETLVLYWEIITLQPGEIFIKRVNWTSLAGLWNVTVRVDPLGFRDNELSNNFKSMEINVSASDVQSSVNNAGNDYVIAIALLMLAATIPLIGFIMVFRNIRKKRLMLARSRIISARGLLDMASEFGGDISRSRIMLVNAEMALERGDARESEMWSRKARDEAMNSVAERSVP